MCAIAGIIGETSDKDALVSMCNRMIKRGPDNLGTYVDGDVALGHRRLSIIDLSTGNQPMVSFDNQVVIVFNGEIYNYKEIKSDLIKLGYKFNTTSDTEVILNGYIAYGIDDILAKLEGMFSFALHDKKTGDVFVARDKFGEKPLFYNQNGKVFSFASELKAFDIKSNKEDIDTTALNLFLSLSYIPAPYTIYKSYRKLDAGTYVKISGVSRSVSLKKYYDINNHIKGDCNNISFDGAKQELYDKLYNSVKRRMIADVPMGAFLSGGIDSSIICALMSKMSTSPIETFSIGFKEKEYDERNRARMVANYIHSNHHEYIMNYDDVLDVLDDVVLYYDEPFGDSSMIPSCYVAKMAKKDVKVVLTGDCADELFAGYEKYLSHYYINKYKRIPSCFRFIFEALLRMVPYNRYTNLILRKLFKVISNVNKDDFSLYYSLLCLGFNDVDRKKVLTNQFYCNIQSIISDRYNNIDSNDVLKKEQLSDIKTVLEGDMFVKVDRACMYNSLENRAPFIDSSICEFAMDLPDDYKIHGRNKKYILKETFKNILPEQVFSFSKSGFGVPVDYWFNNELKESLLSLLEKNRIENQGIFEYSYINQLMKEHFDGSANHKGILWNLFVFQKWYDSHIIN